MRLNGFGNIFALALLAGIASVAGIDTAAAAQAPTRDASDIITVVGCVQKETDYRSKIADGRGGTAGTGLGAANEYVLRSVRSVSAETLKPTRARSGPGENVYSVTGNMERELERAIGKQIAMSGFVEVDTSAGTSKVVDLPRLNAAGWHIVAERCAAMPAQR